MPSTTRPPGRRLARRLALILAVVAGAMLLAGPAASAAPAPSAVPAAPGAAAEPPWSSPAHFQEGGRLRCLSNNGLDVTVATCDSSRNNFTFSLVSPGCCYKGWWIRAAGGVAGCLTVGPDIGDRVALAPCNDQSTTQFFGLAADGPDPAAYQLVNHPGPTQPEDKCLRAEQPGEGSAVRLAACDPADRAQNWYRT
jgi:hypothetical protein